MKLPLDQIEPNQWNPNEVTGEKYEQLKTDMEWAGQREPITVSPSTVFYGELVKEEETDVHGYILCDGEHRFKAAKELGWESIDAEVVELTEDEAITRFYRNQATRGSFNPFKEAELFEHEVKDNGLTEQMVADKYNVTRSYVSGRRMLVKTSEQVRKLYEEPEETYRDVAERTLREELAPQAEEYPERVEEHIQEELEEVAPRGALTPGHIRALASLPNKDQETLAREVVGQGLTVRDVEVRVRELKEKREKQRRFMEAWKNAKVRECPECGKPPVGFATDWSGEVIPGTFRCENRHRWRYDKTQEELLEESKAKYYPQIKVFLQTHEGITEETLRQVFWGDNDLTNKSLSDRLVTLYLEDHPDVEIKPAPSKADKMNEARQNPGYVRHLWGVDKINEKIGAWVHTKVMELTAIKVISVRGQRGDGEIVHLEWEPSGRYVQGSLSFTVEHSKPIDMEGAEGARNIKGRERFRISVEAKDYKSGHKSRIDLPQRTATEEERQAVIRFLEEITETDLDPWDSPGGPGFTPTPMEDKDQPAEEATEAEEAEAPLEAFDAESEEVYEAEDEKLQVREPCDEELDEEPEEDAAGIILCPSCNTVVPRSLRCINCGAELPRFEEPRPEEPTIPVPDHGRGYQEDEA